MNKKTIILFACIVLAIAGLIIWRIQWSNQQAVQQQALRIDPLLGSETAPVRIIEYSDFACSSCRKMHNFLKQAQAEFGDQIAIQFKDYPLTPINPNAMAAAEAGQCALQQNKFWEYHDLLFQQQNQWTPERNPNQKFIGYAQELGLDTNQFSNCLTKHELAESVKADLTVGQALSITQTPTLYINSKPYTGVSTYDSLSKEIKAQLGQNSPSDSTTQ